RRLASRFRCGPDDLADHQRETEAKLAALERDESDLLGLDAPLARAWDEMKAAASTLSEARRKSCKAFAKVVQGRLKSLSLGAADRVSTLVFDEIDAGVGGRLGAVLGKTLAELARHHQVICVTHLPQMASYAQHQWVIRKQTERGRTRATITPLDESDRVEE